MWCMQQPPAALRQRLCFKATSPSARNALTLASVTPDTCYGPIVTPCCSTLSVYDFRQACGIFIDSLSDFTQPVGHSCLLEAECQVAALNLLPKMNTTMMHDFTFVSLTTDLRAVTS